jgi:hypothetical protein
VAGLRKKINFEKNASKLKNSIRVKEQTTLRKKNKHQSFRTASTSKNSGMLKGYKES